MASRGSVGENKGLKPKSKSKDSGSAKQAKEAKITPKKSKAKDDDTVAIDLTNPDDLIKKMEQFDLDEEEMEALMKQAYEVNRELKKQLELGRKVMDKQMTSSAKGSVIGHQRRPGSNMTSTKSRIPAHPPVRQTRMASAANKGESRHSAVGASSSRPMQSYSYHSYKDPRALKPTKKT